MSVTEEYKLMAYDHNRELTEFYASAPKELWALIHSYGVYVTRSPAEVERESGTESLHAQLPLFRKEHDADYYHQHYGPEGTRVTKVTLKRIWGLLERINSLSKKMYGVPVRVDVVTPFVRTCTKTPCVTEVFDTLYTPDAVFS